MATTSNTYTGNGSNKLFSITFPYLDESDIDVYLNGTLQTITTQYTFANATTIEFVTAPVNGAVVLLDRSTDDSALQAAFFPGSSIKASDLNNNFDQVLYIAQETANETATATSTAASATTTANTAASNASTALSSANTALTNSSNAVTTANSAVTTANSAISIANTANTNSNTAISTANAAASAVASALQYTIVANVAAIPGSPINNAAIEVTDSTGIESFTPLSGKPGGFVGSSGLAVRIIYQTTGATWIWVQYFPNDPETRYLKLAGGTLTGALAHPLGAAATPSITFTGDTNTGIYSPSADQVAVATNGVQRLTTDTAAVTSTLPVVHPLGAVGTPSITFTGDLNTGFWSPIADTLAASTAGTERLRITSTGNVGIGTNSPSQPLHVEGNARIGANDTTDAVLGIGVGATGNRNAYINIIGDTTYTDYGLRVIRTNGGANSNSYILHRGTGDFTLVAEEAAPITFSTTSVERARIDSSGRLLVGTSTNIASGMVQIGQNTGTKHTTAQIFGSNAAASLWLARSNNNAIVAANEQLGALAYYGYDGSTYLASSWIRGEVDGTPGANDMPGRLVFSTTADGASSPTERMRIASNGAISTVVPGGSTLYPAFDCRAWVNFNGTGTVAIRASGNVSSITDNGIGNYTVNFSTAMPDANYAYCASAADDDTANIWNNQAASSISAGYITASSIRIGTGSAGATADTACATVSIFR